MDPRFAQLPRSLAERSETTRLADVPALVAVPEGPGPHPACVWMHGRTAHKELDPGRYLRWIRAGIAAIALDLPGHGERGIPGWDEPERTLDVLRQMVREIDDAVAAARDRYAQAAAHPLGSIDFDRLAIGGMSAGGMAALRRLCSTTPPHPFRAAAVESTTGDLAGLYFAEEEGHDRWAVRHDPDEVALVDPLAHLEGWRPIPLLALHSEADRLVPIATQRRFLDALRERYRTEGADPDLIRLHTWPQTGAPEEHSGFGKVSNEAKNLQVEFLTRHLIG